VREESSLWAAEHCLSFYRKSC